MAMGVIAVGMIAMAMFGETASVVSMLPLPELWEVLEWMLWEMRPLEVRSVWGTIELIVARDLIVDSVGSTTSPVDRGHEDTL